MAKYIVLSVEDDAGADALAKQFAEIPGVTLDPEMLSGEDLASLDVDFEVVAVAKRPTQFCTCTTRGKEGFTRGINYGWWIHSACMKPSAGWGTNYAAVIGSGRNQLPTLGTSVASE